MKVDDALLGVTRLYLDTAPIIYFIEANPRYDAVDLEIFGRIHSGSISGVTSVISLTEVLVQPLRLGRRDLEASYNNLLLSSRHFATLSIEAVAAQHAAVLRAQYNLRTPDALQMALAIATGSDAFLTNDVDLRRVTEVRVLVVDDLEL